MKLLEKGALRIDGCGFEHTTTVDNLNGTFGKFGSWVGGLLHGNWGYNNNLLPLLGTATPTTTLLLRGATTFLLYVHHTPYDKDEHESVHKQAEGRGATGGGSDPRSKNPPDETESLRVRNNKKGEAGNDRDDKLLLLLLATTSTTTIFKKTHVSF